METPLNRAFNVAVNHIASRLFPCGFEVSANAPADFDSLVAEYRRTGRVHVWNGASDKTIFACPETNFAFRAWHDWRHITESADFSRNGESIACAAQCRDVRAIFDGAAAETFCAILHAEILGQADYAERRGGFPIDQCGFVRAYLIDAESALRGDFGVSPIDGAAA